MQATRGLRIGFLSILLLAVLLLVSPRHTAGYSLPGDSEMVEDLSLGNADTTEPPGTEAPTEDTTTTDNSSTTTDTSTTTTDTSTDSTANPTTTTTNPTATTAKPTTSTAKPPTSTDEGTTTPHIGTTTTTQPPTVDQQLELLEDTKVELNEFDATLDNFVNLLEESDGARSVEGKLTGGGQDHPAAWWRGAKEGNTGNIDNICIDSANDLCNQLKDSLKVTESLVTILDEDVEAWTNEKLTDLQDENDKLSYIYNEAKKEENKDAFKESVNNDEFQAVVGSMKEEVNTGLDNVNKKIDNLMNPDNTGSVVLVAVIGSIGGLMVVGLIGVMTYGAVKKGKLKKKSKKAAPYNKLQGEHIPIDGFLSDAPAARQPPRSDPYRSDPYSSPYGPRNESNYRGPATRGGQGLPRTQL